MDKIYTRRGDGGETGLLYGGRVSKAAPRCEALGAIDEVSSALGLARSFSTSPRVKEIVKQVQQELVTVGGELATDPAEYAKLQLHFNVITTAMVEQLERLIDELEEEGAPHGHVFIIPGGSPASSAMDLARTILRRAERRVVGLNELGMLANCEVLRYLNRLGDLLFLLARYEDRDLPPEQLTSDSGRSSA